MNLNLKEQVKEIIRRDKIDKLAEILFKFYPTPTQKEIIKDILFRHIKRLNISAMTRYGKTQIIAVAVGLYILFNQNKKVFFIAPTREQAQILRDYLNDLVLNCPLLLELSDIDLEKKEERLKKEVSKSRVTFKNGCEYRVFTAHRDGSGLMGFGLGNEGGLIIIDEATKITNEAHTKIIRMLGDAIDQSQIIELFNPWDRDNRAFEHSISPEWKKYHIDWKIALKENRTTKEFIEQQRKELTPLEFEVLYESRFPEESEDSIFNLSRVKEAINKEIDLSQDFDRKIISCDVADKGLDKTIIFWGYEKDGIYQVIDYYSEDKSENTDVAGKINNLIKEFIKKDKGLVNIDEIGAGTGVLSMVKEFVNENKLDNIKVNGCHFGKSPKNKDRFLNKKAEMYFRLKDIFLENRIKIPEITRLTGELMLMKWEFNSTSKIKIIDPAKSPDYADALVYFVWQQEGRAEVLTGGAEIFG